MKLPGIRVILGLILSLVLLTGPAFAADPGNVPHFAQDHILVKFKAGIDEGAKQEVHHRLGGSIHNEIAPLGVQVVKIPAGRVPEKVLAYRNEKAVQFAEPDFVAEAIGEPNDFYFGSQWGMTKIQSPGAWDITQGSSAVNIAILDTGIDPDHQDLGAKIVANKNFTSSGTIDDLYGHGTHVAGIAAAMTNNTNGVAGVGFDSSLMNIKVLGDKGSGYYSWIASGIVWAANNGAKVINMSLGGSSTSSTLQDAVNYAWGKGVVLVAAAGNGGSTKALYPAYYGNCIAVAATDLGDAKASFSTYGAWVDVAAPGVNIFSTLPNSTNSMGNLNYGYLNGTSMATPHVAGLAGLIWATGYGTSSASVRNRIESTADAILGTGTYWQYGRINAYQAVIPQAPQPPSLSVSASAPNLTNQTIFSVQARVPNSGDTTATGVTATITLPSGLGTAEPLTKSLGDIAGKDSATTSWVVTDTSDGTYTITVEAVATNGSPASGTAVVTADTTAPAQVTSLMVTTVGSSQLNLSWSANTEPDINRYKVYRSTITGGSYALIASPTVNSYSDTGLATGTTYYYVVSAVDTAGNEGIDSTEAFGTTSETVANKMHVQSIKMALKKSGVNTAALATVTIFDAGGRPVPGATVHGHWIGATSGSSSGLTSSNGQVTLQSSYMKRAPSGIVFTFTVDDVVLRDWTYDSAANVETSDSITVP